jgi:hypothetical protein
VGSRLNWTFAGDFNPVMEITAIKDGTEVEWRCVSGHEPWQDGQFRFQVAGLGGDRARLRFWQEYPVELADDYYGVYNFNWGTTWRACGCCASRAPASRSRPGRDNTPAADHAQGAWMPRSTA